MREKSAVLRKAALLSAAACLGLLVILFWSQGISPFGDKTLLTIDAYHQYAPFHAELREKISSGSSLFYSWNGGLGKDFYAQMTYYTYSPLSLLVLLFPEEGIVNAMHLIIALKTVFAVIAAAFAITRLGMYEKRKLPLPLITALALMYTFSGFYAAFYWNVMWLDAMALLPLVLLGLYELASARGKWRFLLSFAACLITNYFMGVIIMFCSLPLYAAILVAEHGRGDRLTALRKAGRYLLCVAMAVGLSALVLVPSLSSLGNTDAVGLGVENPWHFFSRLPDVIVQHFMGAQPQVVVVDDPFANAYSGLLTLLLVPLYFSLKSVPRKRKICALALLVFFYLCMNNELFDYIIHGFHINKALPHRFAFVHTLLLVLLARRVLLYREKIKLKWLGISFGAIVLLAVYSVAINPVADQPGKLGTTLLIVNILMLAAYGGALALGNRIRTIGKILPILLLCAICAELFYSQYAAFSFNHLSDRSDYDRGRTQVEIMREYEEVEGFYRSEIFPPTTINDGTLYGFKGMATFSSIINLNTATLLRDMGYPGTAVAYNFTDNTPFMTSLLNIRYLYDRTTLEEPFVPLTSQGVMTLYENTAVLPLGFVADYAISDFDAKAPGGPFMLQNQLAQSLSGKDEDILVDMPVTAYGGENLTLTETGAGIFDYVTTDNTALGAPPAASFVLTVLQDGPAWVAIDTTHCEQAEITTPEYTTVIVLGISNNICYLGELNAGDTIFVRLNLTYRYANQLHYYPDGTLGVHGGSFNMAAFDAVQKTLADRPLEIESYGDNYINGTADAGDGGVLFLSVPYGEGWAATVDGEPAEALAVAGKAFLGLELLPPGSHEISLRYETPGLLRGALYSAVSLIILIVWISSARAYTNKRRRKNEKDD